MSKILILGGGFAALAAAEALAKNIGECDEIILISKNDNFIFYPGLVPLVFGNLELGDIHFDLRKMLQRQKRIRFVLGEVAGIDAEERTVRILEGPVEEILDFDFLLIALGRKLETKSLPGFFNHAHHILGVAPALNLKHAIADFDAGTIVVGLCPESSLPIPVCETALGLAKKFRRKIEEGEISIKVVLPGTLEQAISGAGLFRDLETEFERKGIHLILDFPIASVHERSILSSYGSLIDYDLLMLMPAFGGQGSLGSPDPFTDSEGFIRVDERMQVAGFDRVYAAGDIVLLAGPKFGYMAIRQGKIAAQNILAELHGETPRAEYKHEIEWIVGERYTDPVFFHYGFWDETLEDFDENAFFGMAKLIRDRYGKLKAAGENGSMTATSVS
jgi:sulfide:quinone oxidoreductase